MMTVRFARPLIAGIAAALLLTMSSCTDDKPKQIPAPTGTTAPSPSPAPDAPQLSVDQKEAFNDAVGDYAEARKVIDRLSNDPDQGMKDIDDLRAIAFSPAVNELAKSVRRLSENGAHLEGTRAAAWQVPVTVDLKGRLPTIEWQQCNAPGDLKVVKDGKTVPQEETNRLLRITSNPDKPTNDVKKWFWRITKLEETGTC